MNLFEAALKKQNLNRPPVWLMRQAGRYHSHYQEMKKKYSFIELCKNPEAACETTMGPIRDFNFDAAILFSDLLFPLEAMGMGLRYEVGPKLDWHLRTPADLHKLQGGRELAGQLDFQAQALRMIRSALPQEKGLLGFVGGPLTLYCYAVEGSHKGNLESAHAGLKDGRWEGFFEKLSDLLVENMLLQARAGASVVAMLDTCAGEVDPTTYREQIVPMMSHVMKKYCEQTSVPLFYYSKGTGPQHWKSLVDLPIAGIGIDWNHNLAQVLREWSDRWAIQGNIDPQWLFLEPSTLESQLREVWKEVKALSAQMRQGWICGLGHGVLPKTPEDNVRLFLKIQKELF